MTGEDLQATLAQLATRRALPEVRSPSLLETLTNDPVTGAFLRRDHAAGAPSGAEPLGAPSSSLASAVNPLPAASSRPERTTDVAATPHRPKPSTVKHRPPYVRGPDGLLRPQPAPYDRAHYLPRWEAWVARAPAGENRQLAWKALKAWPMDKSAQRAQIEGAVRSERRRVQKADVKNGKGHSAAYYDHVLKLFAQKRAVDLNKLDLSDVMLTEIPEIPLQVETLDLRFNPLRDLAPLAELLRQPGCALKRVFVDAHSRAEVDFLVQLKQDMAAQRKNVYIGFQHRGFREADEQLRAAFHQWNDDLSKQYAELHRITDLHAAKSREPLFRGSNEDPFDVFTLRGQLQPTGGLQDRVGGAGANMHQLEIGESNMISVSYSQEVAEHFCKTRRRPWVYVLDPQPHGVQPAIGLSNLLDEVQATGSSAQLRVMEENDATSADLVAQVFEELEVQVPQRIPAREIRGAYPVKEDGTVAYGEFMPNPFYTASRVDPATEAQ